jgi:hypothetical protein
MFLLRLKSIFGALGVCPGEGGVAHTMSKQTVEFARAREELHTR